MMCVMGFHPGKAFLICIMVLIEYANVTLQAFWSEPPLFANSIYESTEVYLILYFVLTDDL